MSYSVTSGKKVFAADDGSGKVMYFLFEKTHESNVYPRVPKWSCIAVGYQDDVVKLVMQISINCESGALKSTSGDIKSENYITAWFRALKKPMLMPNVTINLNKGSGFYSTIPEEQSEQIKDEILFIGRGDVIPDAYKNGWNGLLYDNFDLVYRIHARRDGFKHVPPFKQFTFIEDTYVVDDLGIKERRGELDGYYYQALVKKDSYNISSFFISNKGAPYKIVGPEYRAVSQFITNEVIPAELKYSGIYMDMIRSFKQTISSAKKVPDEAVVSIDASLIQELNESDNLKGWYMKKAMELRALLNIPQTSNTLQFSFKFGELKEIHNLLILKEDIVSIQLS